MIPLTNPTTGQQTATFGGATGGFGAAPSFGGATGRTANFGYGVYGGGAKPAVRAQQQAPAGGITPQQVNPSAVPGQAPASPQGGGSSGGGRGASFMKGLGEAMPGGGGMPEGGGGGGGGAMADVAEIAEVIPK